MPQQSSIPFNIRLAEKVLIPQDQRQHLISNIQEQPPQQQNETSTGSFSSEQVTILSKLPFWINDYTAHSKKYDDTNQCCCFNHYVGLPWKYDDRLPLFDYEVHETYNGQPSIFYSYEHNDCTWILKATGLGITEFSLRYMCWKAITGDRAQYANSKMVIVTGPNKLLAIELISRIRNIFFDRLGVLFESDRTRITLPVNNVTIEAYPSNHVDSFRGLPKVSIVLIDEGDFFSPGEQIAVRDAAERYLGKSRAKIFLVSTPYEPGGLMEKIQKEEKSIYTKIELSYEAGLNKIFTVEEIARAKDSPSFEREYNLQYAYDIGDAFLESHVRMCLDIEYNPDHIVREARKVISMDPAWGGSSKFGIVVSQLVDGRIQILYADEFERADPKDMEIRSLDLIRKYQLFIDGGRSNGQIVIDGANVNFIKYLKRQLNENTRYDEEKKEDYKYMLVKPINFGTEHRALMTNCQELVAKGYVAINKKFQSLLNQMRIAQIDANYGLIKKPHSLDLIDALRMNLSSYSLD